MQQTKRTNIHDIQFYHILNFEWCAAKFLSFALVHSIDMLGSQLSLSICFVGFIVFSSLHSILIRKFTVLITIACRIRFWIQLIDSSIAACGSLSFKSHFTSVCAKYMVLLAIVQKFQFLFQFGVAFPFLATFHVFINAHTYACMHQQRH